MAAALGQIFDDASPSCTPDATDQGDLKLRILSIFIILIGSCFGALFPVLARRSTWLHVPETVFDFAKYFGSGVIIATAFIHLLQPGVEALTDPCLPAGWADYPYGYALCLLSIFAIFIVELIAFRWGTAKLTALGLSHDVHGHGHGSHAAHGPEGPQSILPPKSESPSVDVEQPVLDSKERPDAAFEDSLITRVLGIAILEFGVVLHSVLIGLTLAVTDGFIVLFIVIIFHQTFEGLGVGSRLAYLDLPKRYNYVAIIGALLYGITTPIGIAAGLGVRTTYNPDSVTSNIVSGVLDCLSSGILIYTGLVELLAHEFLFNNKMSNASNGRLAYALGCMLFGCGIMALLGKWA